MAAGTVKWFSDDEGGFIAPGGGQTSSSTSARSRCGLQEPRRGGEGKSTRLKGPQARDVNVVTSV